MTTAPEIAFVENYFSIRAERPEGLRARYKGWRVASRLGGWKASSTDSTADRVSKDLLLRQFWLLGCDKGWEMWSCSCYAESRQALELSECLNKKSANLNSHLEDTLFQQSRHTAGEIEEGDLARCHIAGTIHLFNTTPWRCWENFWLVSKHRFSLQCSPVSATFCFLLPSSHFLQQTRRTSLTHLFLCWSACFAEF